MKEFFGGSQFSQFMDQTNPLAELTPKRRLGAWPWWPVPSEQFRDGRSDVHIRLRRGFRAALDPGAQATRIARMSGSVFR